MLYRSKDYILAPYEIYECVGDVPNVTFPCATLTDAATGRIAIYYGLRRHRDRPGLYHGGYAAELRQGK